MSANLSNSNALRMLLPGIAIAIFYTAFFALPQYRELQRITDQSKSKADAVSDLNNRIAQLSAARSRQSIERETLVSRIDQASSTASDLLRPSESRSITDLARVLDIFQQHEITCIAAKALEAGPTQAEFGGQRVSLAGSFGNMLAAIESIESEVPTATITQLALQHSEPPQPCRWEICLSFEEVDR